MKSVVSCADSELRAVTAFEDTEFLAAAVADTAEDTVLILEFTFDRSTVAAAHFVVPSDDLDKN